MTPPRRPLDPSEVSDLFSLDRTKWEQHVDRCDQCHAVNRRYLEFGGGSGFEMPVIPGSDLHDALERLREATKRRTILLCYECTDDLEEPMNGRRVLMGHVKDSPVKAASDMNPRLFEV